MDPNNPKFFYVTFNFSDEFVMVWNRFNPSSLVEYIFDVFICP